MAARKTSPAGDRGGESRLRGTDKNIVPPASGKPSTMDTPFQILPALSSTEYAELREDIANNGVQLAILVDEKGRVVDGHHRKRIATRLGVPCPSTTITGYSDAELRDMALRLNLHRRHLSSDQKRQALAASIVADPELSDRQHADRIGSSPTTAGSVRRDLHESGDVSILDTRTDSAGRQQPATKPVVVQAVSGYFDSEEEMRASMVMADATEEQFEAALLAGRAEGDLSQNNVLRLISGKPPPKAPRRRNPLPIQWRTAGEDLRKITGRIERLAADDRFAKHSGDLQCGYIKTAIQTLQAVLDRFGAPT